MNIENNNKLLAGFVGKFNKDSILDFKANEVWIPNFGVCRHDTTEIGAGKRLHFHDDWNWLMLVVNKIEKILPDDSIVTIEYKSCYIPVLEDEEPFTIEGAGASKIEAVYNACVEFVKWYNLSKTT